MIFASKYARLRIPVLHEKKKFLGQENVFGHAQWEVEIPHFTAEFAPSTDGGPPMLERDRLAALRHFAPNGRLFGTGSASDEPGYIGGTAYDASDERWKLGVFDSNDEKCIPLNIAQDWRELIEERLCQIGEYTQWRDFVKIGVAVLDPPWPKYEETHHNQIAGVVKAQGYNIAEVIAYERARDKPRPTVIEQLEALAVELSTERSEQAALEVTIGG